MFYFLALEPNSDFTAQSLSKVCVYENVNPLGQTEPLRPQAAITMNPHKVQNFYLLLKIYNEDSPEWLTTFLPFCFQEPVRRKPIQVALPSVPPPKTLPSKPNLTEPTWRPVSGNFATQESNTGKYARLDSRFFILTFVLPSWQLQVFSMYKFRKSLLEKRLCLNPKCIFGRFL
jgi:hypothetical protein